MTAPGNLSRRARNDLSGILERSTATFGIAQAERLEGEILRRCHEITAGRGLGHIRPDMPLKRMLRFWPVPPFVIVYCPRTLLVIRILHGRRDIPASWTGAPPDDPRPRPLIHAPFDREAWVSGALPRRALDRWWIVRRPRSRPRDRPGRRRLPCGRSRGGLTVGIAGRRPGDEDLRTRTGYFGVVWVRSPFAAKGRDTLALTTPFPWAGLVATAVGAGFTGGRGRPAVGLVQGGWLCRLIGYRWRFSARRRAVKPRRARRTAPRRPCDKAATRGGCRARRPRVARPP